MKQNAIDAVAICMALLFAWGMGDWLGRMHVTALIKMSEQMAIPHNEGARE